MMLPDKIDFREVMDAKTLPSPAGVALNVVPGSVRISVFKAG
jgi:hypothetical protein